MNTYNAFETAAHLEMRIIRGLEQCGDFGVGAAVRNGVLEFDGPAHRLPDAVRELLQKHSTEVVALMTRNPATDFCKCRPKARDTRNAAQLAAIRAVLDDLEDAE